MILFLLAILMSICAVILAGLQGRYAFYAAMPVALTFGKYLVCTNHDLHSYCLCKVYCHSHCPTYFSGVGFGAYCAVDFALVMDVLPNDREKAKDLAVWHQVHYNINILSLNNNRIKPFTADKSFIDK